MNRILIPGKLMGQVAVPSSKSMAHRYLLCAALAKGESRVGNVSFSADIEATLNGVTALGAEFSVFGKTVRIAGGSPKAKMDIDCGESGSSGKRGSAGKKRGTPLQWKGGFPAGNTLSAER